MPWAVCLWAACLSGVLSVGMDGERGPPPVLTDPERALMWANTSAHLDPGTAAEVALHAGDPERTLEILELLDARGGRDDRDGSGRDIPGRRDERDDRGGRENLGDGEDLGDREDLGGFENIEGAGERSSADRSRSARGDGVLVERGTSGRLTNAAVLRLRLDALIRLGARVDLEEALRVAHDLAVVPGWRTHAASAERVVKRRLFGARLGRIGLGLFAACLGALLVGGGRALLRVRVGELLAVVCFAGGIIVGSAYSPALRPTLALGAMAVSTLTHAASATVARTIARPKARLLLVVLFLLGTVGVALALAESAWPRGLALLYPS